MPEQCDRANHALNSCVATSEQPMDYPLGGGNCQNPATYPQGVSERQQIRRQSKKSPRGQAKPQNLFSADKSVSRSPGGNLTPINVVDHLSYLFTI